MWYCCETLELVVELAEVCPAFLRPRVSQCVAGMVQVCTVVAFVPWRYEKERERETRADTRIERCLCTHFCTSTREEESVLAIRRVSVVHYSGVVSRSSSVSTFFSG